MKAGAMNSRQVCLGVQVGNHGTDSLRARDTLRPLRLSTCAGRRIGSTRREYLYLVHQNARRLGSRRPDSSSSDECRGTDALTAMLGRHDDRDRRRTVAVELGVDQRDIPTTERGNPTRALAHSAAAVITGRLGD
jgi:hypothetical protein